MISSEITGESIFRAFDAGGFLSIWGLWGFMFVQLVWQTGMDCCLSEIDFRSFKLM